MKVYFKLLSVVLILVLSLTVVGMTSVVAESTYAQPEKFIYGDVDMDGVVTVKDATLIQKGVADITYVTAVQRYLADPAGDGLNVKDATAIQKYLADYEVNLPIGEEIVMAKTSAFSGAVWSSDNYFGECLHITPVNASEDEYTLEDFPEYNFSKIEKKVLSYSKSTYYMLYLQDPGKENALEALKALDYRANIDIKEVYLDYYAEAT